MAKIFVCGNCDANLTNWVGRLSSSEPACPECGAALEEGDVQSAAEDVTMQWGCGLGAAVGLLSFFSLYGVLGESAAMGAGVAAGLVTAIVFVVVRVKRRQGRS